MAEQGIDGVAEAAVAAELGHDSDPASRNAAMAWSSSSRPRADAVEVVRELGRQKGSGLR